MARKNRYIVLADLALFLDYVFRLASAVHFHRTASVINASCMICLILFCLLAYLFTLSYWASSFYGLLGACVLLDLIPMGLIHSHAFTPPYLFAHCCIACFYLALPAYLRGKNRYKKRH